MYLTKEKYFMFFIILSLLILSFITLDLSLFEILKVESFLIFYSFILEFLKPNLTNNFLMKMYSLSIETLLMSIISTFIASIFAFILMLSISSKSKIQRYLIQSILNFLRSIPELLWGLILVISFGLGPITGTLSLFLHTFGILGKLFLEVLENNSNKDEQNLFFPGIGEYKVFLYQILPKIFPQLLSFTLYRWENNIRAATILGVIGAGGLGQELYFRLSLFHYNEVSSIILFILIIVFIVDYLSNYLRKNYTGR
tara:strand:+ start:297 stop:1064 length:768 start_codon:yes stop_codon:yes gene_type:complete